MVGYDDVVGAGGRPTSAATSAVDQKGAVTLSPQRPIVGEAVTATLEDSDGSVSVQAWEWEGSPALEPPEWSHITDATFPNHKPGTGDAGRQFRVFVTYEDGSGLGRVASSVATAQVDRRGTVTVQSRNLARDMPEVGVWQDAELIDLDGKETNQVWRWEISPHGTESERVWIAVPGTQSSSYKPVEGDAGKIFPPSSTAVGV